MIWRWLYRRANRCRLHHATQDPYEMTCRQHRFRTESPTEMQAHVMEEILVTERALNRRVP